MIDITAAQLAPHSGTGIYVNQLLPALEAQGVEVLRAANPRRRPAGGGPWRSVHNLAADLWWCRWELPRRAGAQAAEVIHHPLAPLHLARGPVHVVTLHDLAFERLPECFDPRWRWVAHHTHRAAARRADAVVAVSETTAADARELWGVDPVLARHGPGQLAAGARSGGARHFLYVGDGEPRKNLPLLLGAYATYRRDGEKAIPLVLAGSATGDGAGIEHRRDPSAVELGSLLAEAAALLQPSRYEGFGLTALEAMAAGVPVLAARSPGLTEVCGEAALYADADTTGDWARALGRLAGDPALRGELAAAGQRRAEAFSWATSALAHRAAYSLALESR
ncbi:MAG TPA: glycosyltransferase family 1 protein [Solirubrobacteraceae bacterium]|nr:glycosyltransferase family 1 protein [Solirubrobacteraceae bacterium]